MIRPRHLRSALLLALAALAVYLWTEHLGLALDKRYSIDEFQYAHGAWKIAQGEVIFRDFFEHHFPLIHQLLALVWLVAGDEDPGNLLVLRLAMAPFWTLIVLAAWRLNAGADGRFGLLAGLFVLMVPTFSMMAVEVRPDPLAFALFLAALAALTLERLPPRWRGAVAGFLCVAAVWGTLKVAYYGLVVVAALVADLARRRRGGDGGYLLGHPIGFLLGGAAAALPIAIYLTWTGSWGPWLEWTIRWSFVHQYHYPGFLWTRNFAQLLAHSFWLFPLAAVGVTSTLRRRPDAASTDWLLLGALVTALASFAWQSAAYLYSLVPFTVILALFAARGAVATARFAGRLDGPRRGLGIFLAALLALVVLVEVGRARTGLKKLGRETNDAQHALLSRVAALTRPDEPVFNIAGGQVARPAVHYFYFFEAVVRQLKHDVFAYEVPRSLLERGCVAYLPSERFHRLPLPLRRFLLANYLPYDRELWFWGRRYRVPAGELEAELTAVRDGRYFVWPLELPAEGELSIGPVRVHEPIVGLAAGRHTLRYRGDAEELFVAWLPADGRPFAPRLELQPPAGE